MGSVVKSIGQAVGKIAPIASTVASFIPGGSVISGLLGKVGGVASAASNQGAQDSAQNGANAATGGQAKVGNYNAGSYLSNEPGYLNAVRTNAGFNPDGTYNPNYNPNAQLAQNLYGSDALNNEANTIFDPHSLLAGTSAHREGIAGNYDNAVAGVKHDLAGSGFSGGNSSDAQISGIRRSQASDNADYQRKQLSDFQAARQNYVAQGTQAGKNLDVSGVNYARGELGSYGDTLAGQGNAGVGTLGGVNQQYQGRANDLNKANNADAAAQAGLPNPLGGNGTTPGTPPFVTPTGDSASFPSFTGGGSGVGSMSGPFLDDPLAITRAKRNQSTSLGTTLSQSPSPVVR